jgi:hypothetical protein
MHGRKTSYSVARGKKILKAEPFLVVFALIMAVGFRVSALIWYQQGFLIDLPLFSVLGWEAPSLPLAYAVGLNVLLGICFVALMQVEITNHSLLRSRSFLPLFFALILSNMNPNIADANLNFILLMALVFIYFRLFDCYHLDYPQLKVFNVSAVMGFLCLLDVRLMCLMPVFWYMLFRYKALTMKSFAASLLGLGTAFGLLAFYLFVAKSDASSMRILFRAFTEIERQPHSPFTWARGIYLGTIFTVCTISWLNLKQSPERTQTRIILASNRVALVSTNMLSVFFLTSDLLLAATIVPMTILLGYLLSSFSGWLYRILFFLFIAAVSTNFFLLLWKY